MTDQHNPTARDTAADTSQTEQDSTERDSLVDAGADLPEDTAGSDAEDTAGSDAEDTGAESDSAVDDQSPAHPDSGGIPTGSGEDYPPESAGNSPQPDPGNAESGSGIGSSTGSTSESGVLGDEDHLPPGQTEVPVDDEVVIDDETMRRALEAILMVTDEPLPVLTLARAVGRPTGDVSVALEALAEEYTEQGRGFDLREVGGGWRYYTRVEAAPYVERFVLDGQQARLTQAALETLAVVAYKQPVSRARVSAIRGVNVDGVMRTLIARGLVEEAGADTESHATLYRTTSYFLERMGMQSLDDLPELAPYLPDMDDIEEELAAQAIPPASPEPEGPTDEATTSEPAADVDPNGKPADAADEPVDGESAEAEDAKDADAEPVEEPAGSPADAEDESAEGDTGIDGDLTTDEPVELDVEREPGDLGPSKEVEPAGEAGTSEPDQDPADPSVGAEDEAAEGDTGIDGDLTTDEPVELELGHEPGEFEPSEEVRATDEAEADEAEGASGEVEADEQLEPSNARDSARDG